MAIHIRAGRRIRTDFIYPPIPLLRKFDWSAIDDSTYDGAPGSGNRHQIGYGATEAEAIADLEAILAHANACLCDAAPELYEALLALVSQVERSNAIDGHGHALARLKALRDARIALAKATGFVTAPPRSAGDAS